MWTARTRTRRRMREASHRLRMPGIYQCFRRWSFEWEWARRLQRRRANRGQRAEALAAHGDSAELVGEVQALRQAAADLAEERIHGYDLKKR